MGSVMPNLIGPHCEIHKLVIRIRKFKCTNDEARNINDYNSLN